MPCSSPTLPLRPVCHRPESSTARSASRPRRADRTRWPQTSASWPQRWRRFPATAKWCSSLHPHKPRWGGPSWSIRRRSCEQRTCGQDRRRHRPRGDRERDRRADISASIDTTIHMASPAADLVASPSTVAAPQRSIFQTDSLALRYTQELSWAKRGAGVAIITGVNLP